jgi:hypothetical protein
MTLALNRDLLANNTCFGCGLENANSLQLEIRRDPASATQLVGRFMPAEHMAGFPNITHGGAGWIKEQGSSWDPLLVQTEARGANDEVCVEAPFKVVPLTHARFAEIAGIAALPPNWQAFLS